MENKLIIYPWLEKNWQQFLQYAHSTRMPHAFILEGPSGIGKTDLIQKVAQLLLCLTPSTIGPCGNCRSCHWYAQQTHPDYCELGTEENGANIEDIRKITEFATQTAHQSHRKVVTLFQADKLLPQAANALLKTLEEPPEEVVFFLISEKAQTLLPTILSRCSKITIPVPAKEISMLWLTEKYPHKNPLELQSCLALARGAPLKAEAFIESNAYELGISLFNALLGSENAFYHEDIQRFITHQPVDALYLIYSWITECIRYTVEPRSVTINTADAKLFQQWEQKMTLKQGLSVLDHVQEALQALRTPGVNKQLLFESLFHKMKR